MNLFLELRRHGKLADKRNPMYDKGKFAEYFIMLMAFFWAGYLIFFGTLFGFAFDGGSIEPYHVMNAGFIFVFMLDFLIRCMGQKTPTQEVKPYLLLPIKRNRLIDMLLIRSGMSGINLIWLFMFVPFAILTVTRFYGIWGVITYCLGIWLLALFNNDWYQLCRTRWSERIWWILLPLGVYGGIIAWMILADDCPLYDLSVQLGEGFIQGWPLTFLGVIAAIVLLCWINRTIMSRLIYNELNKTEDTTVQVKTVSEYKFLDRWGEIGEYMRLELKMMLRNKICKTSLRTITILVLCFSALLSFTDIYDGAFMTSFLLSYNFIIFGILFLSPLMCYEGNYIDGLMSRKESIYTLLRAKYTLYSVSIIIPFILMIPTIVMGKISFLSCLGWAIFVSGFVYFCMFQLAVYNTNTIGLNIKMTNRQNLGTGIQNLVTFAALGVPLALYSLLNMLFGEDITALIQILIGLAFILTNKYWLKNVYNRFMKRRYQNLEGFRNSRQKN